MEKGAEHLVWERWVAGDTGEAEGKGAAEFLSMEEYYFSTISPGGEGWQRCENEWKDSQKHPEWLGRGRLLPCSPWAPQEPLSLVGRTCRVHVPVGQVIQAGALEGGGRRCQVQVTQVHSQAAGRAGSDLASQPSCFRCWTT